MTAVLFAVAAVFFALGAVFSRRAVRGDHESGGTARAGFALYFVTATLFMLAGVLSLVRGADAR